MSILIIGEKPSVSRAISAVVGASSAHKGYTEGNGYIVSWCIGHLVGLKFPNDYGNGWDQRWSFSQLPMLPEKWQFRVTDSTKAQYELLKNLMNRVDVSEIICATDADREGECIFRYVYNMANCKKPVKRLWVSSLEESAIRKALTSMKPMSAYDNLFNAGYSRARADWLVGMNGSRLFSVRYGGKLNIGRVQTPTLAMIVQRDAEVNGFIKQKYYTADLNCGEFILSSARIDDENAADTLVSSCDGSTVTISSVKREVKTDNQANSLSKFTAVSVNTAVLQQALHRILLTFLLLLKLVQCLTMLNLRFFFLRNRIILRKYHACLNCHLLRKHF